MARGTGAAAIPVDATQTRKGAPASAPAKRAKGAAGTAKARAQGAKDARTLSGPWGASFDGHDTPGLSFPRRWTTPGIHPYDEITWERRDASIGNESGKSVFEQKDVEVPNFWSQLATNVVVSKYFRGHLGTAERETSVRQLIDRVVNTIAAWAETAALLRDGRGPRRLQGRADPSPRPPEDGLQLAGLVQRRDRAEAAVQRVLHQLGPGLDVLDHGPRQDRGDALQVRVGRGQQPVDHPELEGEDVGRRHRVRARSPS